MAGRQIVTVWNSLTIFIANVLSHVLDTIVTRKEKIMKASD
jgi:hypothetical protein